MDKKRQSRMRRARRSRAKMRELGVYRLCVYRTPRHIYAQIINPSADEVVACASSVEKELKGSLRYTGNVEAAAKVGQAIADRAKGKGIERVAFDRSGFQFHGRVKALADAAREGGLEF